MSTEEKNIREETATEEMEEKKAEEKAEEKTEGKAKEQELHEEDKKETGEKSCKKGKKDCKKEGKKEKARIEELEAENERLKAGLAKEKDDYMRMMAEFDNFRRRTSQEKLDLVSVASMETIKGLLPILDDCERAMEALKNSTDSAAAKEGTELIYNKLISYLKTKGLEAIQAKGEAFDTDLHEAVAQFPVQEEEKKGKVFDVVQTGYTLNGKVIRYAKVVVGI